MDGISCSQLGHSLGGREQGLALGILMKSGEFFEHEVDVPWRPVRAPGDHLVQAFRVGALQGQEPADSLGRLLQGVDFDEVVVVRLVFANNWFGSELKRTLLQMIFDLPINSPSISDGDPAFPAHSGSGEPVTM